jgi:spore germination protein YaaH
MKKTIKLTLRIGILFCFIFIGGRASAATTSQLEISGWIPYWRTATGTAEALSHLDAFTEINPFGYTVKTNGQLYDAMNIGEEPWTTLIKEAHSKKVRVIPTIMWGNPDAIHAVLSNKILRDAQIADIVNLVNSKGFDGIDIDYEAKYAKTKDYYSIFLRDLYKAMGKKWVMCEVESRTPVTSRYDTVPADYDPNDVANDYVEINKYCDRVRIMAYDQSRVDVSLNRANQGLYAPVSDPKWVEKLVNLASETIDKKKIVIGIPTYGYEYIVSPGGIGGYSYVSDGALNPVYATDIAKALNLTPQRTSAGELSLLYYPNATSTPVTGVRTDTQTNLLVWSDAKAIEDKVNLAKKLGVRGVAIFKIDGGADKGMWDVLKNIK